MVLHRRQEARYGRDRRPGPTGRSSECRRAPGLITPDRTGRRARCGLRAWLTGSGPPAPSVRDAGDLPGAVFQVDHEHPRARNLSSVVTVARAVADAVAGEVLAGQRPLVIGGDCTITLGVVAGFRRVHPDVGLAYVDGDADLGALEPETSGILDAAGISHLLGDGEPELAGLDGDVPLLAPARLAMVGCDPRELTAAGRAFLAARGVSCTEGPSWPPIRRPRPARRWQYSAGAGR